MNIINHKNAVLANRIKIFQKLPTENISLKKINLNKLHFHTTLE